MTAAASVRNEESNGNHLCSMNDDADDESELSELDESAVQEIAEEINARHRGSGAGHSGDNVVPKPFFPSLIANKQNTESSGTPGSST